MGLCHAPRATGGVPEARSGGVKASLAMQRCSGQRVALLTQQLALAQVEQVLQLDWLGTRISRYTQ